VAKPYFIQIVATTQNGKPLNKTNGIRKLVMGCHTGKQFVINLNTINSGDNKSDLTWSPPSICRQFHLLASYSSYGSIHTLLILDKSSIPTSRDSSRHHQIPNKRAKNYITPRTPLVALPAIPSLPTTTPALLKAFNLCILGAVIFVIAVANFSLSVSIVVLAALPLCLVPVSLH
jgi:hypothetical protein